MRDEIGRQVEQVPMMTSMTCRVNVGRQRSCIVSIIDFGRSDTGFMETTSAMPTTLVDIMSSVQSELSRPR
jgi:hypothetical protein